MKRRPRLTTVADSLREQVRRRFNTVLRACGSLLVFGTACGGPGPLQVVPLDCRVSTLSLAPAEDLQRWSGMIVTPLADLPLAEEHHVRTRWTEGRGLTIVPQVADGYVVFFAPYALAEADGPASGDKVVPDVEMKIELGSEQSTEMSVYWTDDRCQDFSPDCSWRFSIADQQEQGTRVSFKPELTGHAHRLKLVSTGLGAFTINSMTVDPAGGKRAQRGTAGPRKGLHRSLHSGNLGWVLGSGERLTCEVPAHLGRDGHLPDDLSITVPEGQKGPGNRFFRIQARWVFPAHNEEEAGVLSEAFEHLSMKRRTQRYRVPLSEPSRPPEALEIDFLCDENCSRADTGDFAIEIERPWGRGVRVDTEAPGRSLILVVVDTLRADHLSTYGHPRQTDPHTSRWAQTATVYEHMHAVDIWTLPGHAALFTGRYPLEITRPQLPQQYAYRPYLRGRYETLAEVLRDRGYMTAALTDPGYVSPRFKLDQGFERYECLWEPFDRRVARALKIARNLRNRRVPYFLFLHTYAVHEPYSLRNSSRPREYDGTTAGPKETLGVVEWSRRAGSEETVAEFYRTNYDEAIRGVDAALAPLYEARDVVADAVLCVTSDHGEGLFQYDVLGHRGPFANPALTWIPFMVSGGPRPGRRVSQPMSQTAAPGILLEAIGLDGARERLRPTLDLPVGAVFAVRNPLVRDQLNVTTYVGGLQLYQAFRPEGLELTFSEVRRYSDGSLLYRAEGQRPLPSSLGRSLEPGIVGIQKIVERWAELHLVQGMEASDIEPPDSEEEAMLRVLGYVR